MNYIDLQIVKPQVWVVHGPRDGGLVSTCLTLVEMC